MYLYVFFFKKRYLYVFLLSWCQRKQLTYPIHTLLADFKEAKARVLVFEASNIISEKY